MYICEELMTGCLGRRVVTPNITTSTCTSMGGGSMKSKVMRSLTPIALRERTVEARLVRWISGTAVGNISSL